MRLLRSSDAPGDRARRRLRRAAIGAAVGVLAVPLAVVAGRAFTDVPPSNPAFRDIEAVADAGLMSGANNLFRPREAVTRQALARILHRGLHRASVDETVDDITVGQP